MDYITWLDLLWWGMLILLGYMLGIADKKRPRKHTHNDDLPMADTNLKDFAKEREKHRNDSQH